MIFKRIHLALDPFQNSKPLMSYIKTTNKYSYLQRRRNITSKWEGVSFSNTQTMVHITLGKVRSMDSLITPLKFHFENTCHPLLAVQWIWWALVVHSLNAHLQPYFLLKICICNIIDMHLWYFICKPWS